jgi:hypothetical protein
MSKGYQFTTLSEIPMKKIDVDKVMERLEVSFMKHCLRGVYMKEIHSKCYKYFVSGLLEVLQRLLLILTTMPKMYGHN